MMKKVFKIGLMVSLLLASTGVFAQNQNLPEDKPEFPRVGFKSFWSWGGALELTHQFAMNPHENSLVGGGLGRNRNIGFDVFLQRKINHMFDLRIRLDFTGVIPPTDTVYTRNKTTHVMAQPISASFDAMWSINNAIMGYDPDRKWSVYLVAGAGVTTGILDYINQRVKIGAAGSRLDGFYDGLLGMNMNFGFGGSFAISSREFIFAEYNINAYSDFKIPGKDVWENTGSTIRFGYHRYFYDGGISDEDLAILDQRSVLTFTNFRNLEKENKELKQQVQNARSNEQKLENRVSDLEKQIESISKGGRGVIPVTVDGKTTYVATGNSAAADSLQAVIDGIKADQLNFYAMPFSVLYGVDEWNVSEEEMNKVKAVARVMKDNPGVKVMVVGFADYTGSDQYNMKLSEKRANEVKRLLVKKYGIAEDRISTDYKGKSVAFGDIQYALNRRVSFYRVID